MKYKRLTKRFRNSQMQQDVELMGTVQDGIFRLAELEDKIEQGKLIELNDKLIGESVYGIQKDTAGKYWFDSDENTLLGFTATGIVTWNDLHGYNDWFENGFWFFTREEAEKKLQGLQE